MRCYILLPSEVNGVRGENSRGRPALFTNKPTSHPDSLALSGGWVWDESVDFPTKLPIMSHPVSRFVLVPHCPSLSLVLRPTA